MGTQALHNMISREELIGLAVFGVFGAALIALAPTNQTAEPASDLLVHRLRGRGFAGPQNLSVGGGQNHGDHW